MVPAEADDWSGHTVPARAVAAYELRAEFARHTKLHVNCFLREIEAWLAIMSVGRNVAQRARRTAMGKNRRRIR